MFLTKEKLTELDIVNKLIVKLLENSEDIDRQRIFYLPFLIGKKLFNLKKQTCCLDIVLFLINIK